MGAGKYDAVLFVSFGGPERREDVLPFLENVVRGKRVPRQRLLAVAEHYYAFGGRSPINAQNLALIGAVRSELAARGPALPIYWGNRNWHPLLTDTLRIMAEDGARRALALVTSAFSSYSGCRQYRENIAEARSALGGNAPVIDKIRPFFNHPGFIDAMADRVGEALGRDAISGHREVAMLYSAHSIPRVMAETSSYVDQLHEAAGLVSQSLGIRNWEVVFQSRSGPPSQPWLEPDVCDRLRTLAASGVKRVCVAPLGFLSDHIEVLHDLDTEAAEVARELGVTFVRSGTVGTHPQFVSGIRDLIAERSGGGGLRVAVGGMPPCPDECPAACCPPPPIAANR